MQNQLIILVPGIAGSKLYCNCDPSKIRRLYPRKRWFFNSAIDKHAFECDNIETKPLRTFWYISVYDKFLKHMSTSSSNHVATFSYDWRRNPVDLAYELLAFIEHNLKNTHYTHLKLIGHSMGGLLIRIMCEHMDDGVRRLTNFLTCDQITVYECGTPMYGSTKVQDYNYGFELAAVIAAMGSVFCNSCPLQKVTKREIRKIKPFLFSTRDLTRIIQTSTANLLYLLPTPMIFMLHSMVTEGQLLIPEPDNRDTFNEVYKVHKSLSKLAFPFKYIFFFNISVHKIEKVYIPFKTNDLFTKVSVHDIDARNTSNRQRMAQCGLHLRRLLKSDGLVVPYSGQQVPFNCNIYVDESEKCTHAYLMNSTELWRLALNSQMIYANPVFPVDELPGYEDIFGGDVGMR